MGDDDNLIFDTGEPSKRPAVDIDCPVKGGVFGDHWDLYAECKACELDGACCVFSRTGAGVIRSSKAARAKINYSF
jgi:hypothetical protein